CMRRLGWIAWYVLVVASALLLLALVTLFSRDTQRHAIGSTEIYCLLYGERIIIDIHDRHGWWNLFDQPLFETWLVPVGVIALWLELMRRKLVRASGRFVWFVRPLSFVVMFGLYWLSLTIRVYSVRQVPEQLFTAIAIFAPAALIVCIGWA